MKKGLFCLTVLMLGMSALQWQTYADAAVIGAAPMQSIVPGAIVQFGNYEQDNDDSRTEPIDWYVLATEGDTCLLLSKYALMRDFYQRGEENVTWETSDIRAWLNSEFISEAFTQTEQDCLVETLVRNSDSTYGGNDTIDRVFLLSVDEACYYFISDAHRRCAETAYAKEQEVLPFYASEYTLEGEPSVWWWLRTTVDGGDCAVGVKPDGDLFMGGGYCNTSQAVRPAIWVKMSGIEGGDPSPSFEQIDSSLLAGAFEAYAEIVARYRDAVRNYRDSGIYPEDDMIDRSAVETQNYGGTSDEELKAGLYDLNNDGLPELFLGTFDQHHFPQHQTIYAVYTYQNGYIMPVFVSTSADLQLSAQGAEGMWFFSETILLAIDSGGKERYYLMSSNDGSLVNTSKEQADASKPVNYLYVLDMDLDYVLEEVTLQKVQNGSIETKLRYYDPALPQNSSFSQSYIQQDWMKK